MHNMVLGPVPGIGWIPLVEDAQADCVQLRPHGCTAIRTREIQNVRHLESPVDRLRSDKARSSEPNDNHACMFAG
ncbi:hypothetical protein CO666_19575 [Rhizobium chutanense]|uniref:Uncharacterized protein n=1 Tax=Rhizobium chutanense TaxID=2035448 RepID=A0A2A6J995_9HYPH|nr:hypothetical protein CO666_19575 [Rhizobium chutanense]